MSDFSTPQEAFWAGQFGHDYIARNDGEEVVSSNMLLFGNIMRNAPGVHSILELGCNIGLNLQALRKIDGNFDLAGIEINEQAADIAAAKNIAKIRCGTIVQPLELGRTFDLTFTKTVLIHIHPDYLPVVYDNLYRHSNRYIMVCEYYNPSPMSVSYRGHDERLFKRDFAGELIERYGLKLVNYGFAYRRDNYLPYQDDVTWFLLQG